MLLQVYSIYDKAARVYGQPFFAATEAVALRSIRELTLDSRSTIHSYPSDFALYRLCSFDDSSGAFSYQASPELVVNCDSLISIIDKE